MSATTEVYVVDMAEAVSFLTVSSLEDTVDEWLTKAWDASPERGKACRVVAFGQGFVLVDGDQMIVFRPSGQSTMEADKSDTMV